MTEAREYVCTAATHKADLPWTIVVRREAGEWPTRLQWNGGDYLPRGGPMPVVTVGSE
jgi:hypothetical protein